MNDEEKKFDDLKDQNIHLSAAGRNLLDRRHSEEMIKVAKQTAGHWQNRIDIWNKDRVNKYRGFDGMTLAMVLEIYSMVGDVRSACLICQVCDKTLNKLRLEDEDVRDAMTSAKALYAGRVQAKLTKIAFDGMKERVYDKDGNLIRIIHKESEQILKLVAEGAMPEKYGRKRDDGQRTTIPIQINMYLDKEPDGRAKGPAVQLEAEGLPAPGLAIPDEGDNPG